MNKKSFWMLALIILPLLAGLACRFTAADPTATPVVVVAPEETQETEEAPPSPTEETSTITEVTAEPPTEEVFQDLVRLDKNFWIQKENTVFVAFFFQNPNSNLIFEDVKYTVHLFNAQGVEIDSDTSYVRWVFPSQTFAIAFNFYLSDETIQVDSATVDWVYDSTSAPDGFSNPFTIRNVQYWEDDEYPMVTGSINNEHAETYTDIRTNIIFYDSAGDIVGGGLTFIDFIPGQDYMGFATYIDAFKNVASVEVFPTFSYRTNAYEGEDIWSDISIQNSYFYQSDSGNLMGGALLKNESDSVLRNSVLYATFYDDAGNVTCTGSRSIDILLPGTTLGVSPWALRPPDGTNTVEFDVLVLPGEVDEDYELTETPFVVNSTTLTGDFDNHVLVSFTNTYNQQASDADVYVLLYNAEGGIIGGGTDWTTEPISAGGTMEVEVWVDYSDSKTVHRIEAWVVPSFFTEFE